MVNEKRLIDANALMRAIRSFRWFGPPNTLKLMFEYLWLIIRDEPTVDAVEVVRCRNCEYYVFPEDGDYLGMCKNQRLCVSNCGEVYPEENYFCPYGKRNNKEAKQ